MVKQNFGHSQKCQQSWLKESKQTAMERGKILLNLPTTVKLDMNSNG